jgi:hypothetical protein
MLVRAEEQVVELLALVVNLRYALPRAGHMP